MGEGAMKYSSRSDVWGILVLAGPLYYIMGLREIEHLELAYFGDSVLSLASNPLTAIISNHIQTNTMGFLPSFNAPTRPSVPSVY